MIREIVFGKWYKTLGVVKLRCILMQCSNEAASGAKNQEQEQAGSGAEASTGSQELLKSLLSGASV